MAVAPTDRKQGYRWKPGQSGNPAGRAKGSRNAALLALDAIGTKAANKIMTAVVKAATGGDMRAADILLRRLWPERKGRPIVLALPPVRTAADLPATMAAVIEAVAAGEATPEEAQALATVLEAQRRAVETAELEARIGALEEKERK